MNNVYDNGQMLIGNVKDIIYVILNNMLEDENDNENMDILSELEQLNSDDIVYINYDSGMGYILYHWTKKDIIDTK